MGERQSDTDKPGLRKDLVSIDPWHPSDAPEPLRYYEEAKDEEGKKGGSLTTLAYIVLAFSIIASGALMLTLYLMR